MAHTRVPISLHRWPYIMLTLDQKSEDVTYTHIHL